MTTATSTIKDPICGMPVDAAKAIHVDRSGKTYYFCGAKCRDKFLALPLGKKPVKSGGCCGLPSATKCLVDANRLSTTDLQITTHKPSIDPPPPYPNRKSPMPAPINVFFRPFLALAVALACVLTTQSIQAAEPANGGAMTAGTMMEQCKAMQAHKQQMMADMKAQDTALSEQVAQMNSTTDDKKLGLLAALVTRMAEQRIARDTHMAAMSDEMMKHMMQHMQMGKESMQGCPMMKGMGMNDMKGMGANDMKGKGANNMKGMDDKTSEPAKGQK